MQHRWLAALASILGGLVLRVEDKRIDASVNELAEERDTVDGLGLI